ncbi:hypothetical protein [Aestuariivivens sediminicola]|uniref:hypothetical protein n=1 Tax=Aestuariivivens sediminicola TaxID=2913560 RepID=UPI001F5773B1|nr:hypothetical protein [Aestuariivivens sediminicola]
MKKLKILLTMSFLMITLGLNAQPKPEKKAKKFADEMTEVLSLNKKESQAIYEIQVERFTEIQALRKTYADDPETLKEKQRALGKKVFNQVKNVIGKERQQQWKAYKSKN